MKDFSHATIAIAPAVLAPSACAMSAPVPSAPRCRVIEDEKLPVASGGANALCEAIKRAATARGLPHSFDVEVGVGARSMLAARVTLANGAVLPALHMAEMDRPVTRDTLDRFGAAIADHIAGVAH